MLDALGRMARLFWYEFRYSYRGHKKGGRAAELATEREQHVSKRLDEALDDMEAEQVARAMVEAETPEEKEAALSELKKAMGLPTTPEEERAANDAFARALNAARDNENREALEIDAKIEALRETRQEKLTELSLFTSKLIKDIESQWPGILDGDGRWNPSDPLTAVISEMAQAAHGLHDVVEAEQCAVHEFDAREDDPVEAAMEHFNASWARMDEYLKNVRGT